MDTTVRTQPILDKFQEFYSTLDAQKYTQAQKILDDLSALVGEDSDITGMQIQLDMGQI